MPGLRNFHSENLARNYDGFMTINQWYEEKADYVKSLSGAMSLLKPDTTNHSVIQPIWVGILIILKWLDYRC